MKYLLTIHRNIVRYFIVGPQGPMWCQIRGQGLSYNYRIACKPDSGQLYFQLFKSAQLVQAYKVAMEIMV